MKFEHQILASALLSLIVSGGWAADIGVPPGQGTLAAAVAAASNGDTLVLQDGGFYGAVTVNKSLTIRPVNRATNALVDGPVNIDGAGITVTLQGLKFSGDVYLSRAAAIRLLENEWLAQGVDGYHYQSSQGDGSLVIVGNRFAVGSRIRSIYSDGAYIAGNTLFGGFVETDAYVWIVGNEVRNDGSNAAIISGTGGASAFILGNRVYCDSASSFNIGSGCLHSKAPFGLIAGNIVQFRDSSIYVGGPQNGIYAAGSGETTIINNVVQGLPASATRSGAGISVHSASAKVAGNIVIDFVSSSGTPIFVDSLTADVTNNLCHNNTGACPAGNGNLNADPKFVDLVDFALSIGSPAIDAGPPDYGLADLDRTRNDMGVHGGPWSIGQYDAQRAPGTLAPFVYPLFKTDSNLSGGLLDVKALGVARLR